MFINVKKEFNSYIHWFLHVCSSKLQKNLKIHFFYAVIDRGTTHMLFGIQYLIEKIRDTNGEMYVTFIDYSKALTVIYQHLFEKMEILGFPKYTISLISSLYKDKKAPLVRTRNTVMVMFLA